MKSLHTPPREETFEDSALIPEAYAEPPIARLPMLDVDSAPDGPGLYAWYAHPQVVVPMSNESRADEDAAADFVNALQRYALLHEPSPISIKGASSYNIKWEGELRSEYPLASLNNIVSLDSQSAVDSDDDYPDQGSTISHLQRVATSPSTRSTLTRILGSAIPVFATPLYIGITENLRKRLKRHKADFERVSDYLRNRPDDRERALNQARTFGHRAAARQVAMEDLEVWLLDVSKLVQADVNSDDVRVITSSAEWYLHRLFSPILGRR